MDPRKAYPVVSSEYRLVQEIGHGVSATVYEAECIPLGETVAIKSIDLERLNANLDDIRREAQTMSLIDHPNVLRAHCSFIVQHNLWVVMPFMAGGSCQSIMQTSFPKGFEEAAIVFVLRDTLRALHYLHQQGHIHRDVKAGNILIDSKGAVKLADFGVSACLFESGSHRHKRNTFVGTPCWMAPEVIDHNHGYDHRADIWSLGITALELAHGHAPFSKFPPMKALLMQLQGTPPTLDDKFSRSFREMVGLCLVKDPARRPSAEKLLKHSLFRHAKSPDYIVKHVLENLPNLADRLKIIRAKENLKMHDDDDEDDEHQNLPHIRRISGWNFNENNLQFEPMYRHFNDRIFEGLDAKDKNIAERAQNSDVDCEPNSPNPNKHAVATGNADAVATGNADAVATGNADAVASANVASATEADPNHSFRKEECGDADPNQSSSTGLNSCCDPGPNAMAGGEPEGVCDSTVCANSEPPAGAKEASESTQMEAPQQPDKKEGSIHSQRHAHAHHLEEKQHPAVDSINKAAANGTEHGNHRGQGVHGLKLGMIQKKGRFSVTQEDGAINPTNKLLVHHPLPPLRRMHSLSSSPPSTSAASGLLSPGKKCSPHELNSHNSLPLPMVMPISISNSTLLPQLQSLLQTTLIQQDTIFNLLNDMGVGTDHMGSSTTMQRHERESEHMQKIIDLQGKVSALMDEVQAIKAKNAQMEHQLNAMSMSDRDEKDSTNKGEEAQPIITP